MPKSEIEHYFGIWSRHKPIEETFFAHDFLDLAATFPRFYDTGFDEYKLIWMVPDQKWQSPPASAGYRETIMPGSDMPFVFSSLTSCIVMSSPTAPLLSHIKNNPHVRVWIWVDPTTSLDDISSWIEMPNVKLILAPGCSHFPNCEKETQVSATYPIILLPKVVKNSVCVMTNELTKKDWRLTLTLLDELLKQTKIHSLFLSTKKTFPDFVETWLDERASDLNITLFKPYFSSDIASCFRSSGIVLDMRKEQKYGYFAMLAAASGAAYVSRPHVVASHTIRRLQGSHVEVNEDSISGNKKDEVISSIIKAWQQAPLTSRKIKHLEKMKKAFIQGWTLRWGS